MVVMTIAALLEAKTFLSGFRLRSSADLLQNMEKQPSSFEPSGRGLDGEREETRAFNMPMRLSRK